MLYVNFIILMIFLILNILSVKRKNHILLNHIDKKEHKLYFLYPTAAYLLDILDKIGLAKYMNDAETAGRIKALYVTDNRDRHVKLYFYKKVSLILSVVFLFSFFSLTVSVRHVISSSEAFDGIIRRPECEEEDESIRLKFRMENETDGKDVYEDEIVINNYARSYTQEEWEQVLKEAIPYMEREVLGENNDPDYICLNLNFFSVIPKTGITVEWIPEDYSLITAAGTVQNAELSEKKETTVTAILKYRDRSTEHTIPLTVWPKALNDKEKLLRKLQDAVDECEKQTADKKEWILPDRLENYIIKWEWPETNPAGSVFILGIAAAALIWFLYDRELENRIKQRNNQMLRDYPEIINKFSLLVNAGMTIKQAWFNITGDYLKKRDDGKGEMRYAYEEMVTTSYELKLGIPEVQAYEQFGRRTGLLSYIKFSSLLVQNLQKGNKDMVDLLKSEGLEAIHERKETAKKLGEEASTKLLAPMVIMLLIVLLIIMIPAFMSFSV